MSRYFVNHQLFYINSRNRITGSDSDFSYKIDIDTNKKFDKVTVLDCEIPKSYYLVSTDHNTFTVSETVSGSPVTRTITMPVGNYNRNSFRSVLQTQLNSGAPAGYTYTITNQSINSTQDTGKYTFTCGTTDPTDFIFTNNLYEQMGFERNTTYSFSAGSLESANVINLNLEPTLFLRSNICDNGNDNILQNIISSSEPTYSAIVFNNNRPDEYSKDLVTNTSNIFQFRLTDEDSNLIDLNGHNIVFTIMLYQTNDIDRLIKAGIKYLTLQ